MQSSCPCPRTEVDPEVSTVREQLTEMVVALVAGVRAAAMVGDTGVSDLLHLISHHIAELTDMLHQRCCLPVPPFLLLGINH